MDRDLSMSSELSVVKIHKFGSFHTITFIFGSRYFGSFLSFSFFSVKQK